MNWPQEAILKVLEHQPIYYIKQLFYKKVYYINILYIHIAYDKILELNQRIKNNNTIIFKPEPERRTLRCPGFRFTAGLRQLRLTSVGQTLFRFKIHHLYIVLHNFFLLYNINQYARD